MADPSPPVLCAAAGGVTQPEEGGGSGFGEPCVHPRGTGHSRPLESFSESFEWVSERQRMIVQNPEWVRALETAVVNLGNARGADGFTMREAVETLGDIASMVPRPLIGAVCSKLLNIDHRIRSIGRCRSMHPESHGRTVARYVLAGVV